MAAEWVLEAHWVVEKKTFPVYGDEEATNTRCLREFQPGDRPFMVSHRWKTKEHPDPRNEQAERLASVVEGAQAAVAERAQARRSLWTRVVKPLCRVLLASFWSLVFMLLPLFVVEMTQVVVLTALLSVKLAVGGDTSELLNQFLIPFDWSTTYQEEGNVADAHLDRKFTELLDLRSGVQTIHCAAPYIGQNTWLRTDDFNCQHPFWVMVDHMEQNVAAGRHELDNLVFWVDWSCLPQKYFWEHGTVRTRRRQNSEVYQFHKGIEWAASSMLKWPTFAIISDDYPNRGWCVVEGTLARAGHFGCCCIPPTKLSTDWARTSWPSSDEILANMNGGLHPDEKRKKTDFCSISARGTSCPTRLVKHWERTNATGLQCTNNSDLKLLANRSYGVFTRKITATARAAYTAYKRLAIMYYFLPAPLAFLCAVVDWNGMWCLLAGLGIFTYVACRSDFRLRWTPHHWFSRKRGLEFIRMQEEEYQLCVSVTHKAIAACPNRCSKGCDLCMKDLSGKMPELRVDRSSIWTTKQLGWITALTTASLLCSVALVLSGAPERSSAVVWTSGVLPTVLLCCAAWWSEYYTLPGREDQQMVQKLYDLQASTGVVSSHEPLITAPDGQKTF